MLFSLLTLVPKKHKNRFKLIYSPCVQHIEVKSNISLLPTSFLRLDL
jgi:hypothetical protein